MGLKLYFDTNIWIYIIETNKNFSMDARLLLEFCLENDASIDASIITKTECLVGPSKTGATKIYSAYIKLFQTVPKLFFIDVENEIAINASQFRAKYNLKTADAIHIATAVEGRVDYFISNDVKLKKIDSVKFVTLKEMIKKLKINV